MVPAILLAQIEDTAHDQSSLEASNDTAVSREKNEHLQDWSDCM
jgi:hypothetical protein